MFCNFTIFQYRCNSPQVKLYVISSITTSEYELPHELPNDLRLRVLENYKILGKYQLWVETLPSAQSTFQKLNFVNSSRKHAKVHTKKLFLFHPILLDFSTLFQTFFPRLKIPFNWKSNSLTQTTKCCQYCKIINIINKE